MSEDLLGPINRFVISISIKNLFISFLQKYKLHYVAVFMLIAYLLAVRIRLIFSYSLDLDGLEYYFVYFMQRVFNGTPIYTNPESFPYSDFLYTPLYIYISSAAVYLSGLDIMNDLHKVLVLGRMFAFLLVLLQIFYFKKIIRKFTTSRFHYLILVCLYLLLLSGHIFSVRPDALKVFLFSIFFYHLIQFAFYTNSKKDSFISVLSALIAVYTKQDIVIEIFICLLTLLYFKRQKSILYITAFFFVAGFILFLLCNFFYGGYFFSNLVLFNFQQAEHLLTSYIILILVISIIRTGPLLLLSLYNFTDSVQKKSPFTLEKYVIIISVISYPVSHLLLLRAASNLNYTYELIFFLILNIAIFLKKRETHQQQFNVKAWSLLLVLFICVLLFTNYKLKNFSFSVEKEQQFIKEYYSAMDHREALNNLIKDDVVFFPDSKYMMMFNRQNLMLGHDMHIDRFLDLKYSIKFSSKLTFLDYNKYDLNFKNGFVKYIVTDANESSVKHVGLYYPYYKAYKKVGSFLVFQFDNIRTGTDRK